jgi:hypothetical protein
MGKRGLMLVPKVAEPRRCGIPDTETVILRPRPCLWYFRHKLHEVPGATPSSLIILRPRRAQGNLYLQCGRCSRSNPKIGATLR